MFHRTLEWALFIRMEPPEKFVKAVISATVLGVILMSAGSTFAQNRALAVTGDARVDGHIAIELIRAVVRIPSE